MENCFVMVLEELSTVLQCVTIGDNNHSCYLTGSAVFCLLFS